TFAVGTGTLALGLNLDPTTGVLSGTPADFGVYHFTIEAENFADGALGPATTVTITGVEAGTVFVSDADNQVIEIPPNGGPQQSVGTGLSDPAGLALDDSGNLYIANEGDNEVVEVPTGGGSQKTIATGLEWPIGVAVDNSGDVFIADTGASTVVEVSPSGTRTTVPTSGLSDPTDVAVDDLGDVFIADFGNNRVVVEQAGGSQLNQATNLDEPAGIALNAGDNIYYADMGDNEVWRTNGFRGPFEVGSNLNQPDSVALGATGNLYIADYDALVEVPSSGPQRTVGTGLYIPIGVTVYAPPPTFTADTPPSSATIGESYSYNYAATALAGEPAPTYLAAAGELPPGLKLNTSTGALTGTPTTAGTYKFTVATENVANAIIAPQTTIAVGEAPKFTHDSPPGSVKLGGAYAPYRFRAAGTRPQCSRSRAGLSHRASRSTRRQGCSRASRRRRAGSTSS
ncbi:MAG: putative Ig domain-containing protein, partial [Acidimicrobiales bacterium]